MKLSIRGCGVNERLPATCRRRPDRTYNTRAGVVRAVDGVSLIVERGQVLGLVGESGCGKSSLALALLRLLPENAQILGGRVVLDGTDIMSLSAEEMRAYRWNRIAMVFQSAMNALDPVYRVGDQIIEALEQHVKSARKDLIKRVHELYELVNLDPGYIQRYPHEYSGGMKQRAIIAMALACEPDLIIADGAHHCLGCHRPRPHIARTAENPARAGHEHALHFARYGRDCRS